MHLIGGIILYFAYFPPPLPLGTITYYNNKYTVVCMCIMNIV